MWTWRRRRARERVRALRDRRLGDPWESYAAKVVAGELYDATLTFQLQEGFEVRGTLENYIHDEATDSWYTLIVWPNPDYRE